MGKTKKPSSQTEEQRPHIEFPSYATVKRDAETSGRTFADEFRTQLGAAHWQYVLDIRRWKHAPAIEKCKKYVGIDSDTLKRRVLQLELDADTRDRLCAYLGCDSSEVLTGDEIRAAFIREGQSTLHDKMLRLLRRCAPVEYSHIIGLCWSILPYAAGRDDDSASTLRSIMDDQALLDGVVS